jgi:hypothetical protein
VISINKLPSKAVDRCAGMSLQTDTCRAKPSMKHE